MSTALNLIPVTRLEARRRQTATHRWLVGGAAFVALLIALSVFVQLRWGGEPADLAQDLSQATAQTEQTRRQLRQLQAELAAVERRLAANRAVTNQPDYAVLLALFARQLDDQVILRSCAFEPIPIDPPEVSRSRDAADDADAADLPPGFSVQASGLAANQRAVSAYVLRLERTGLFHRVRLVNTRREPTNFGSGRAIAFEIECFLATDGVGLDDAPVTQGGEA
jgi:Tfp pilus assembly protein PilN